MKKGGVKSLTALVLVLVTALITPLSALASGTAHIRSSQTYDATGNYVVSTTDAASNPFEMGSCDKAQKTPFGFYFPIVSQIVGQDSGDFIIGVSKEAHVGLGFHVSAGINIDAFIELMLEE